MAIVSYRRNPLSSLETVRNEIDRLMEMPFRSMLDVEKEMLSPTVDMWDDKDNVYLEADMPGIEMKDLTVRIKGDTLHISAERNEKVEEKKKDFFRSERYYGRFYREIELPVSVNVTAVSASYKNGVLKVTMPKKEQEKEKEKEIKVNIQ